MSTPRSQSRRWFHHALSTCSLPKLPCPSVSGADIHSDLDNIARHNTPPSAVNKKSSISEHCDIKIYQTSKPCPATRSTVRFAQDPTRIDLQRHSNPGRNSTTTCLNPRLDCYPVDDTSKQIGTAATAFTGHSISNQTRHALSCTATLHVRDLESCAQTACELLNTLPGKQMPILLARILNVCAVRPLLRLDKKFTFGAQRAVQGKNPKSFATVRGSTPQRLHGFQS